MVLLGGEITFYFLNNSNMGRIHKAHYIIKDKAYLTVNIDGRDWVLVSSQTKNTRRKKETT